MAHKLNPAAAIIILLLLLPAPQPALGQPAPTPAAAHSDHTSWQWRQPPFIIVWGFDGYPYVKPFSALLAWGGPNDSILYSQTMDQDVSPYPAGLNRSYDQGLSWEHLPFDFDGNVMASLVVHPITPTIILAGGEGLYYPGGLYRSSDGGETWQNLLPATEIGDIEVDPTNANRIYATTSVGIYRSYDYGETWSWISSQWLEDIEVHPTQPNVLFGARFYTTNSYEGVYRSDDWGETWTQVAFLGGKKRILIDPTQPDRIFAYRGGLDSYGSIYRSKDSGQTWEDVSAGLPYVVTDPSVASAAIDPRDGALWVGLTYSGIYVSSNYGDTWAEANNGIPFFGGGVFGPSCDFIAISSDRDFAVNCSGRLYVKPSVKTLFLPLITRR